MGEQGCDRNFFIRRYDPSLVPTGGRSILHSGSQVIGRFLTVGGILKPSLGKGSSRKSTLGSGPTVGLTLECSLILHLLGQLDTD